MVLIIRFGVRPTEFDLGRILRVEGATTIDLELYVPDGNRSGLFFSITSPSAADRDAFVDRVANHPMVDTLEVAGGFERRTLLAMEWDVESDYLFRCVRACEGEILRVTGTVEEWTFVIRFPTHDGFVSFGDRCALHGIEFTVLRIYHLQESRTETGQRLFGLTDAQREALTVAVGCGYFDIPRRCSTSDVAATLGISDQATSERLRRGTANFVRHTFLDEEGVENGEGGGGNANERANADDTDTT